MAKKKNWIAGAIKKPGALGKTLKAKKGKAIPAKTLAKAAKKGKNIPAKTLAKAAKKKGKTGQRARLAQTLKGFKK